MKHNPECMCKCGRLFKQHTGGTTGKGITGECYKFTPACKHEEDAAGDGTRITSEQFRTRAYHISFDF